jgi:uncharacterized protein
LLSFAVLARAEVKKDCHVGAHRLSDGRTVDVASSDNNSLRWQMFTGERGQLHSQANGTWIGTYGWTDRPDGKTVSFSGCGKGVPKGSEKVPVVVLVHGSEYDSAIDSYALQRMFPAQGVGAFVYDKRGTGVSGGAYTQDFDVLADDAIAAMKEAIPEIIAATDHGGSRAGQSRAAAPQTNPRLLKAAPVW